MQATPANLTHAGAVVVSGTGAARRFLIVRPNSAANEWVLPKGHIKKYETPEQAAMRELAEEAGVRAALVSALPDSAFEVDGTEVRVRYFLMIDLGHVRATEDRDRDWCTFEEARKRLTFDSAREALEAAQEDSAALAVPDATAQGYRATLDKQLDFLNERMKETSETANAFLGKFMFGGLVAVIALLNVDLVLLRKPPNLAEMTFPTLMLMAAGAVSVLTISYVYFRTVMSHYRQFHVSHRKLKYKYELTMQALFTLSRPEDYVRYMEMKVDMKPRETFVDSFSEAIRDSEYTFPVVADYFLDHHRSSCQRNLSASGTGSDDYIKIAMLLVVLTAAVRLFMFVG